jgi:hydroxymethylglutaryl-CoA lyase
MNDRVTICEMSLRDGMQVLNRSAGISLEMRLALLGALKDAGFAYIEVGSFVSYRAFPQFQDTKQLLQQACPGASQLAVLVPNLRYYEKFADTANLTTIAMFLSASEQYSLQNKKLSIADDLAESRRLASAVRQRGQRLRAHLSAAFRSLPPEQGPVDLETITRMCGDLIDMGCETVALADTDGSAAPTEIQRVIEHLASRLDIARLGVHLHDRFGQAIANAWEAYRLGIRTFDSAVGGIGGNKAVEKSYGNIATEDLANLLRLMGVETGLDLKAVGRALQIVREMAKLVGDPQPEFRDSPA